MSLEELWREYPDFETFCQRLWSNFSPPRPFGQIVQRTDRLLQQQGQDWKAEVRRWWERQWLPEPSLEDTSFVVLLWQSPLFLTLLQAFDFFPPPETDLRAHLPARLTHLEEFVERRLEVNRVVKSGKLGRGTASYWKNVLHYQAPELFLEPFLPGDIPLTGCDIACGWGRIALTLPHYQQRRLLACDLSQSCLDNLTSLIRASQLEQAVQPLQVDILELPLEDDSIDFFTAFDIFEHLTEAQVRSCLTHLLRCARPGAVLYTEVPLLCFCPSLTHIQNWSAPEVHQLFTSVSHSGKELKLVLTHPHAPEHMTFQVVDR